MPKFAKVQVTLDRDSGLAKDDVTNTFHFDGDDGQTWAEDQDDLADRVKNFYVAIQSILAPTFAGTGTVKVYDMTQVEPRVPVFTLPFTFTPSTADALPSEVAIVLSYRGAIVSGIPRARRRGRVYLGPLSTAVLAATPTGAAGPRVPAATITTILNASDELAKGPDPGDFRLAVYSPTIHQATSSLDQAFEDVVEMSVDNEFDTQRRRGQLATTRTAITIT